MTECSSLVLLGFVDQPIKDESNIYWATNKIGGESIFPKTIEDSKLANLMDDQLICPNCVKLCSPICQIQCAVDDNPALRLIYVFACLQDNCNHFSVFRFIHHQESSNCDPVKVSPQQQSNQRQIWANDSSNWSDDDGDDGEKINLNFSGNNSQQIAESLELTNTEKGKFFPKKISNNDNHIFQPYYIYVENLEDLKYSKSYSSMKQFKYNLEDEDDNNFIGEDGEKYENPEVSTVFSNDKKSYKFYKSLRDWPGQIIRYSWKGQPLLNKSIGFPGVDDCPNCGCKRTFELQLMPGLISQLKCSSQSNEPLNIDFGTVLIYCCSNNCDNQQFNEEKCIFLEDLDSNVIDDFVSSRGSGQR